MYTSYFQSGSLNLPFTMFFLNMVNYPVFFPFMSTLTWDTFLTLRGTWGFYLVLGGSAELRLRHASKSA